MRIIPLLCAVFFIQNVWSQELATVNYKIQFNQKFDQNGADVRNYTGHLKISDATASDFYMLPQKAVESTEQSIEIPQDTVWKVRTDLDRQELFFDDVFNEKFVSKWYSDSLFPMRWVIGNETAVIDSLTCTRATTDFRGRKYIAWFSYEISLPFGPWKLGGLPGLIVHVEDSERNLVISLERFSQSKARWELKQIKTQPYAEYLKAGNNLRRIMRLSVQTTGCVDCESTVKFHSWEKIF